MVQKSDSVATKPKIGVGLQARISSRRFPNKVFHEIEEGFTVLDSCLKQSYRIKDCLNSKYDVEIALLVPREQAQVFEHVSQKWKVPIVTGPEDNVLKRYENFQKEGKYDYIVRLTADCPCLPPFVAADVIEETISKKYDYGCTHTPNDWFDGADVECFSDAILKKISDYAFQKKHFQTREHVTWPIKNDSDFFALKLFFAKDEKFKDIPKLSIDTTEDLFRVIQIRKSLWWM